METNEFRSDFQRINNLPTFSLEGRLDGYAAKEFERTLTRTVRKGESNIIIDMEKVSFLDSRGIQLFIRIDEMLKERSGRLYLCNIIGKTWNVMEMAGGDLFFLIYPTKRDAIRFVLHSKENVGNLLKYVRNGCEFRVRFEASTREAILKVVNNISNVLYARLKEEDIVSRRFSKTEYSIGLGAFGPDLKDYFYILGEMITIGGGLVWMPTNSHNIPNYFAPLRDTGKARIRTGFNVALDGTFNDIMVIRSKDETGLKMSDLYKFVFDIAKEKKSNFKGVVSLAMQGDIGEVYSSCLKISPIEEFAPENGEMIKDGDNFKKWFGDSTSHPKYQGETIVGFGVGVDLTSDISSFFDEKVLDSVFYIHPKNTENKKMLLHNHGAIFKHIPWEESLMLDSEIKKIMRARNREPIAMCHLLDNTTITHAVVGVSYITDIVFEERLDL